MFLVLSFLNIKMKVLNSLSGATVRKIIFSYYGDELVCGRIEWIPKLIVEQPVDHAEKQNQDDNQNTEIS